MPPAVQGEQEFCGSCLWIDGWEGEDVVAVCTGQVGGDWKEQNLFSSKKIEDGQDSLKAENGKGEINPVSG